MAQGTIKRLVRDRGFGFIQPDEGQTDLFFHRSGVEGEGFDSLMEGQPVEFDREPDPRQPNRSHAVRVRARQAS